MDQPFQRPKRVPITNREFVKEIFRGDRDICHVTGFLEDPGTLDTTGKRHYWGGGVWTQKHGYLKPEHNNFFTVSVFDVDPVSGQRKRRKVLFLKCYCIVLDDVNLHDVPWEDTSAKVGADKLCLDASWALETSPNNYQIGYILTVPETRGGKVSALLDALVASGLVSDGSDPGMKGVTRYVRLPVGTNTKKKYGSNGFKHNLTGWNPERKYSLEDIADAYGVRAELDEAPDELAKTNTGVVVDPETDWQLKVLNKTGKVLGERVGAGGEILWDVECPFVDNHTQREVSGTVYMGEGRWDCRHSCSEKCCLL